MPKDAVLPASVHSTTERFTAESLARELADYLVSKQPTKEQAAGALVLINRTVNDILKNLD